MSNGDSSLYSLLWGWLTHTSTDRVGSIVLPWWGVRPALQSAVAGVVRDSSPTFITTGSPLPSASVIDGYGGGVSLTHTSTIQAGNGDSSAMLTNWGWLNHTCASRIGSIVLLWQGARLAAQSAAAGMDHGLPSCSHGNRVGRWAQLFPTHAAIKQMAPLHLC